TPSETRQQKERDLFLSVRNSERRPARSSPAPPAHSTGASPIPPRSTVPRPIAWRLPPGPRWLARADPGGAGRRSDLISKRTATTREATVPWHGDCSGGRGTSFAGAKKEKEGYPCCFSRSG